MFLKKAGVGGGAFMENNNLEDFFSVVSGFTGLVG